MCGGKNKPRRLGIERERERKRGGERRFDPACTAHGLGVQLNCNFKARNACAPFIVIMEPGPY